MRMFTASWARTGCNISSSIYQHRGAGTSDGRDGDLGNVDAEAAESVPAVLRRERNAAGVLGSIARGRGVGRGDDTPLLPRRSVGDDDLLAGDGGFEQSVSGSGGRDCGVDSRRAGAG